MISLNEEIMKDYRLTIKIRNNHILNAIECSGGEPGQKWCSKNGLNYSVVNDLINMAISPLKISGELTSNAYKLCDVLGKLPEELWSAEQLYPLEKNFSEMEMDYAQIVALLPQDQQSYTLDFSEYEQNQTKELLSKAVSTLTFREQKVIRLRFEDDLTLEECGNKLDITRDRVRQLEMRALRKLRSPAIVEMYVDAVDFS